MLICVFPKWQPGLFFLICVFVSLVNKPQIKQTETKVLCVLSVYFMKNVIRSKWFPIWWTSKIYSAVYISGSKVSCGHYKSNLQERHKIWGTYNGLKGIHKQGFKSIHFPHISEDVKSLTVQSSLSGSFLSFLVNLPTEKGGLFGWQRFADSFFNIRKTEDMVGLSYASSWTHSNPTCIYLRNWSSGHGSDKRGSVNSSPLPSFQRCQACTNIAMFIYYW